MLLERKFMRYLLLFGLTVLTSHLFGQDSSGTTNTKGIILVAEIAPEFPGGPEALYKFISSKLKYPKDARKNGVEGKVVVSFIVERDGSVKPESIKIERSVYPSLDMEAIRVVKLMPKWTPANQKGRDVRAKTGFPIIFKLQ
jgi:periplasmic protein TonB